MTPEEKAIFIANADPFLVVQEFPFEYTINMRMGPTRWHISVSRMSELEVKSYKLACELLAYEGEVKALGSSVKELVHA